jgi:hypothetical protein
MHKAGCKQKARERRSDPRGDQNGWPGYQLRVEIYEPK